MFKESLLLWVFLVEEPDNGDLLLGGVLLVLLEGGQQYRRLSYLRLHVVGDTG